MVENTNSRKISHCKAHPLIGCTNASFDQFFFKSPKPWQFSRGNKKNSSASLTMWPRKKREKNQPMIKIIISTKIFLFIKMKSTTFGSVHVKRFNNFQQHLNFDTLDVFTKFKTAQGSIRLGIKKS